MALSRWRCLRGRVGFGGLRLRSGTSIIARRLPKRLEHAARAALSSRLGGVTACRTALTAAFRIWELHKRLHIHRTLEYVQVPSTEKVPISGAFAEPSDGLEPSTPSLPWKSGRVTRVHRRSIRTQFFLQIGANQLSRMRREASRVSFLMCPFCVRVVMPGEATSLRGARQPHCPDPTNELPRTALRMAESSAPEERADGVHESRDVDADHPLILGTLFLLAFAGGLAGLWSLRTEYVTPSGISDAFFVFSQCAA